MFNIEDMNENVMWNCPDKDTAYFFITNNKGFYKNLEDDRFIPFEWILENDKKTIKCYLTEIEDEVFFVHYLTSEDNNYLCEIEKNGETERVILIKEKTEEYEDQPISKSFKKMDFLDKIFAGLFVVVSFLLLFLAFNFAPFFESIGFMYSFIFTIIVVAFTFKKIIGLSLMMSKNHKETLKKWFMD